MKNNAFLLLLAVAFAGCGVDKAGSQPSGDELESTGDDTAELSATSRTYVTLRRDFRKCVAPACGGYFVQDVNRANPNERYVNSLDFSKSTLSADDITVVLEAPTGELVLRGKLGPIEHRFNTRPFLVYEAYRGMPGIEVQDNTFYTVQDSGIRCVTVPCASLKAKKLNTTSTRVFDGVKVDRASAPLVDQTWLSNQVMTTQAIVAAKFVDGETWPAGTEELLDASQVYLRVPQEQSCPQARMPQCEAGTERSYSRDENRCMLPGPCVAAGPCIPKVFPSCATGYTRMKWLTAPNACVDIACDPTWLLQAH